MISIKYFSGYGGSQREATPPSYGRESGRVSGGPSVGGYGSSSAPVVSGHISSNLGSAGACCGCGVSPPGPPGKHFTVNKRLREEHI